MSHHESLSNVLAADSARRDMITGALAPAAFRRAVDAWIGDDRARMPSSALMLVRIDWEVGPGHPVRPTRADSNSTLRLVTEMIEGVIRTTDLVGRVDEETIGILMPSTPSHQTERVCRRIRATVSERSGSAGMAITVSIGVASPRVDDPWVAARRALSEARADGGDRTAIAHENVRTERHAA